MLARLTSMTGRLAVAALAVAAALLLRLSFASLFDRASPYVLFFPTVLAAGFLGGRLAGVAATFFGAAASLFLFDSTISDAALLSRETGSLAAFLAGGVLVSLPAGAVHDYLFDLFTRASESRRRAAQLEALLAGASVGIACFDRQRRTVRVNPTLATLRGLPVEKLLGQAIDAVLPLGPSAQGLLEQVFASGEAVVGQEMSTDEQNWLLSLYPVREGGLAGEVELVGAVVVDISGHRRREDELRSRAGELAESGRRKDVFLAMLSHELRNPLAALRSASELLTAGEPVRAELVTLIRRQTGMLTRLVDDLLDTARVSRGQIELRRHNVNLAAVIEAAVETAMPAIEERRHRMETVLSPRPMMVRGDNVRLTQALANLLHNAARYTPEGGRVTILAEVESGEAVVRVADTGIGIRQEMLGRIFELFAQADQVPGQTNQGLGLGLTLVRRLVELHGGNVTASSPGPGKGSTFEVRLPMLPMTTTPTPHPPALSPPTAGQRVLIVDDNDDAAESLSLLLQVRGHEVRVVYDGPAALEAVEQWHPGVVFLDIGLPGLDGFEVARLLREKHAEMTPRLIALTGFGHEKDRQRGKEVGFDEFLVKPAGPEELSRAMQPAAN